ncbi:unnamed protein product [Soboliphyme baturini]|uniref:METTL13 n=1 Tax=Soboliphyme baturini TaxID=241478 RepID=A0A183ISI0_9BILA|nr:unnamed protein product [Soboliphyme baturini]
MFQVNTWERMTFNAFMHPRNLYKHNRPNFAELAQMDPEFKKHCRVGLDGMLTLDFKDPQAVRALTLALLKKDFDLEVDFPLDSLVPRVPLRLNYILWLEDIVKENKFAPDADDQIFGIDIGNFSFDHVYIPSVFCQLFTFSRLLNHYNMA